MRAEGEPQCCLTNMGSVANLVAMAPSAKNLILLGDQMQLGQPIQGVHPERAESPSLNTIFRNTSRYRKISGSSFRPRGACDRRFVALFLMLCTTEDCNPNL